jgi:hypothetical protein
MGSMGVMATTQEAGPEAETSSLSEMDGWAQCYPAFALVTLLRKWHRDGVNRRLRA